MNPQLWIESEWTRRLGWTVFHAMWQILAVLCVLAIVLALTRRRSPQLRYALSCVALAAAVLAPAATFWLVDPSRPLPFQAAGEPTRQGKGPTGLAAQPVAQDLGASKSGPGRATARTSARDIRQAGPGDPGTRATASRAEPREKDGRFHAALDAAAGPAALAWCLGVAAVGLWQAGGWAAACRLGKLSTRRPAAPLARQFQDVAHRLAVTRPVRLLITGLDKTPMVLGWLRPVVLLPACAVTALPPRQIEALLAHELAHVRRLDGLAAIFQAVAETLGFVHPGIWWISRRVRIEREHCCDDLAAAAVGGPLDLARSLHAMEAMSLSARPTAAAAATEGSTLRRVRRLLTGDRPARRPGHWAGLILAGLLLVGMVGWGCRTANQPETRPPAHDKVPEPDRAQVQPRRQWIEVTVAWQGASPAEVEQELTLPIEQALGGLDDLVEIRSDSQQGKARIHARFRTRREVPDLLAAVRQAVPNDELPAAAGEVTVSPAVPDGPPIETERIERTRPVVDIQPDPERLARFGLTPQDVSQALARAADESLDPKVVIKTLPDGTSIRVSDVAEVVLRAETGRIQRRWQAAPGAETPTRTYDMRKILDRNEPVLPQFGSFLGPQQPGSSPESDGPRVSRQQRARQIQQIFYRTVQPESWQDPGRSMDIHQEQLVVTHRQEVHDRIGHVLDQLVSDDPPQVQVTARFLTVSPEVAAAFLGPNLQTDQAVLDARQFHAAIGQAKAEQETRVLSGPRVILASARSGSIQIESETALSVPTGQAGPRRILFLRTGVRLGVWAVVQPDRQSVQAELFGQVVSQPDPQDPWRIAVHRGRRICELGPGQWLVLRLGSNLYRVTGAPVAGAPPAGPESWRRYVVALDAAKESGAVTLLAVQVRQQETDRPDPPKGP